MALKEWCIPKAGAEFVAAMEDVVSVFSEYNGGWRSAV